MLFKKKKIEGKLFYKIDTLKDDERINNLGARLKRTNCIGDYRMIRKGLLFKYIPQIFSPKYELWGHDLKLERCVLKYEIQFIKSEVFRKNDWFRRRKTQN